MSPKYCETPLDDDENQSINQSIDRRIDQSINQPKEGSMDRAVFVICVRWKFGRRTSGKQSEEL
jgi:hypothetical protein